MKLGADEVKWRWIDPDGKEQSGSKGILSAQLAGALPARTLVWRSGWAEWVPANKVAELAHALPAGSIEKPLDPSKSADPKLVPPKPELVPTTGSFSTVVPAPRNAAKFVRPQISPPKITLPSEQKPKPEEKPPSSFGKLGGNKRPEPGVPPQSAPRPPSPFGPELGTARYEGARPPMPTLADEAAPATATLRPPGAVPPPPRSAAKAGPLLDPVVIERFAKIRAEDTPLPATTTKDEVGALDVDVTLDDAAPTQRKDIPPDKPSSDLLKPPSELVPAIVNAPPPSVELPSRPEALPPPSPAAHSVQSKMFDSTLSSDAPAPVPLPPAPAAPPRLEPPPAAPAAPAAASVADHTNVLERKQADRRLTLALYMLGGTSVLLALLAVVLMLGKRTERAPEEAPSASVSASVVTPPTGCSIVAHPARLGATVDRSVPPLLAAREVDGRLALGFAESSKKAQGLLLSPATLDASSVLDKTSDKPLKSVVPLVASGAPTFAVDSDGGPLKFARTVDAKLPFSIGLGEGSIARVVSSTPEPIWPTSATAITEPRVASVGAGHAVAFRDGGLEGKIMLGWLGEDGSKRSELAAVPGPKLVGTPFVAAADSGYLLVFAGRDSNQEPWRVELASGEPFKTEAHRVTFQAPAGGVGGGQIAPSAAALPGGQWLLQWTEGKTGMYQVRTQLLSSKLELVGEPLQLSPKGASSGQGSLFVAGKYAVSLYIQTIGGHDELWATTLECR